MNKARRKRIAQACNDLRGISDKLQDIMNDEQDAFDNYAEHIQSGDTYDAMEHAVDTLESAVDAIEEVISDLEDI